MLIPARAPRLVAFDLDDTLAPSKSPVPEEMTVRLRRLLAVVPVAIISGGRFAQFRQQVIERLGTVPAADLAGLHLLPACGTQYYRWAPDAEGSELVPDGPAGGSWRREYSEDLNDEEKDGAIRVLEEEARRLGLWEEHPWGPIVEDRESQITFSALGQSAPVDAKAAWDPDGAKRRVLRAAVAARLPGLEVRAGGSTSVDITRPGIDKAYGMRKLAGLTGLALTDMLFVGDRLEPDGNDYPVKALGVPCVAVGGHRETPAVVDRILERLRDREAAATVATAASPATGRSLG
ncbi:MAG TPA: HAD family hydrolase [Microbacteriaceae bacterium]|nr:HAD family hydrolase [Microbacteriaceae bacterium]